MRPPAIELISILKVLLGDVWGPKRIDVAQVNNIKTFFSSQLGMLDTKVSENKKKPKREQDEKRE
jgi:hypothetical protein